MSVHFESFSGNYGPLSLIILENRFLICLYTTSRYCEYIDSLLRQHLFLNEKLELIMITTQVVHSLQLPMYLRNLKLISFRLY